MTPPQPEAATVDAAPLDEIHVEALIDPLDDPNAPPPPAPVAIMDKAKFFDFFASLFTLTGNAFGMVPPLHAPMQSLTRAPALPTARPASDAIYDLAEKYEWMHWLIEEDTDAYKALVVIGAFGIQVGMAVRNEVQMRNNVIHSRTYQEPRSDEGNRTEGRDDPNAQPVL